MIKLKHLIEPKTAYHVTYLSNLENILTRGILPAAQLPKKYTNSRPRWERDLIFLFVNYKDAYDVSQDIGLNRHKDWVLLQVRNLNAKFIGPDEDWGMDAYESIKNKGRFSYKNLILPKNITVLSKAIATKTQRHDEFRNLK